MNRMTLMTTQMVALMTVRDYMRTCCIVVCGASQRHQQRTATRSGSSSW
jgi:hypothetical protein